MERNEFDGMPQVSDLFVNFGQTAVHIDQFARFFNKVRVRENDCWTWHAAINGAGYGCFDGRMSHRVIYEWAHGPIPAGMQLDHICRNRGCVNPDHLEAVTRSENVLRAVAARGNRCKNGHEWTEETSRYWVGGEKGKKVRYCLLCRKESKARVAARKAGL